MNVWSLVNVVRNATVSPLNNTQHYIWTVCRMCILYSSINRMIAMTTGREPHTNTNESIVLLFPTDTNVDDIAYHACFVLVIYHFGNSFMRVNKHLTKPNACNYHCWYNANKSYLNVNKYMCVPLDLCAIKHIQILANTN